MVYQPMWSFNYKDVVRVTSVGMLAGYYTFSDLLKEKSRETQKDLSSSFWIIKIAGLLIKFEYTVFIRSLPRSCQGWHTELEQRGL